MSEKTLLSILVILVSLSVGLQIATISQIAALRGVPNVRLSTQEASVTDAPSATVMNIRGIPVSGHPSASAVIVEFTDYECPYCLRHANTVLPQLRMKYEWTAQVRYAVANFPLWIHKNADTLARAAVCSIEQNRFWDLHIAMFSKTPRTEDEVLILAENLGINPLQLQTCMEGQFATDTIRRERELATALGIESTPSFVIGTTDADGKLFVKKLIIGAQPVSAFEAALADVIGLQ